MLLRRKYVLWRCALVCERLRCEPWRPWLGMGATTRGLSHSGARDGGRGRAATAGSDRWRGRCSVCPGAPSARGARQDRGQAWRRGDTHAAAAASRRAIRAWREATGTVEQRCILGDAVCGEKRILKHSLEKRITAPPSAPSAPQRSWEEDRRKRRGVERLCNPLGAPLRRGGVVRG